MLKPSTQATDLAVDLADMVLEPSELLAQPPQLVADVPAVSSGFDAEAVEIGA